MCIVYKLWFVVNVHSASCNAVCHVLLGYIVLELAIYCILVFTILLCGGVGGWNNDKGLCSKFVHINCVDRVVDGPHGW